MRAMKWTSLTLMLLLAFGATAQEEFFDDIYYSAKDTKEAKAENVEETTDNVAVRTSAVSLSVRESSDSDASGLDIDVDAYNRRYDGDAEEYERMEYVEEASYASEVSEDESDGRRSDLEYSERIVRFHSPSKLTIVGADEVDLYVSDGYYAYDYDANGGDVNIYIDVESPWYYGWYPRWYYGWYNPWWYSWYDPWWYYSWYVPYWGWHWGGYWGPHFHGHWAHNYWAHGVPLRHYSHGRSYAYNRVGSHSVVGRNGRQASSALRSSSVRDGRSSSSSSLRRSSASGTTVRRSSVRGTTTNNKSASSTTARTRQSTTRSSASSSSQSSTSRISTGRSSSSSTRSYSVPSTRSSSVNSSRSYSGGSRSSMSSGSIGGGRSSGGSFSGGGGGRSSSGGGRR